MFVLCLCCVCAELISGLFPIAEYEFGKQLSELAKENEVCRSYIGLGYYGTIVPPVIKRNILENPGW